MTGPLNNAMISSDPSLAESLSKTLAILNEPHDSVPPPIAKIINLDVEGPFAFSDQITKLRSYIREADLNHSDSSAAQVPFSTRSVAVDSLIALTELRQPPMSEGIVFEELQLIIHTLISWVGEAKELAEGYSGEGAQNNPGMISSLEQRVAFALNHLIEVGFALHQTQFETTLLPVINSFKRQSSVPDPLSSDQLNLLIKLTKEMLGVDPEYMLFSTAMLAILDVSVFDETIAILEELSGSVSETAQLIEQMKNRGDSLKHVKLNGVNLSKFCDVKALVDLIGDQVETLELTDCKLSDSSTIPLVHLTENAPNLVKLDLSRNQCSSFTALAVFEALSKRHDGLKEISFADNQLTSETVMGLIAAVQSNQTIETVNLNKNYIDANGFMGKMLSSALEEAIQKHPSLRTVSLESPKNRSGDS